MGFRKYALFAVIVGFLSLLARNASAEGPVCRLYREGWYSNFLVELDGRVWLLSRYAKDPFWTWHEGTWSERTDLKLDGTVHDIAPVGQDAWAILAGSSGDEVSLFRFSEGALSRMAIVGGRFRSPTLHLTPDGVIWILSRFGVAYGVRGKERFTHALGPPVGEGRASTPLYPPTAALDVPGEGTWFWSQIGRGEIHLRCQEPRLLAGFHVYRDGQWHLARWPGDDDAEGTVKTYPWKEVIGFQPAGTPGWRRDHFYPKAETHDALSDCALAPDGRLLCAPRYGKCRALNPSDGVVEKLSLEQPVRTHCTWLHTPAEGHLLAITAWPTGTAPVTKGWGGTLLWSDGQQTRTLLEGVDFGRSGSITERPSVDTAVGTFIAAARAGLILVSRDGQTAKRLDWRHGLPIANITRLCVQGDALYALDSGAGFAVLNWRALSEASPKVENECGRWTVDVATQPVHGARDNSIWYVRPGESGVLRHHDGNDWTDVPLPDDESFRMQSFSCVTSDTRGRIWLIGSSSVPKTALLEDGNWRVFEHPKIAYSTVALEEKGNPGFAVGTPEDKHRPIFAGDRRVAYRPGSSAICFLDDKETWNCESEQRVFDGQRPEGPPFYQDGILTVRAGGPESFYQWRAGAWEPARQKIRSPYTYHDTSPSLPLLLPASFPGNRGRLTTLQRDNMGAWWAGGVTRLYHGLGDTWVEVPPGATATPLSLGHMVTAVHVDSTGGTWFDLYGGNYRRVVQLDPQGKRPVLKWHTPPSAETADGSLTLTFEGATGGTLAVCGVRVDAEDWHVLHLAPGTRAWTVKIRHASIGEHSCKIRLYDEALRASTVLRHDFKVPAPPEDPHSGLQELVARLGAADYNTREDAVHQLAARGQDALPALQALLPKATPEQKWWLEAVIQDVARGPGEPPEVRVDLFTTGAE